MNKKIIICLIIFFVSGIKNINTQSLYSAGGIGELRHFLSVRAAGIGGTGLTIKDEYSPNLINPSLWAFLKNTTINGSLFYEDIKFNHNNENYNLDKSQLYNVGFVIKANTKIAMGLGLSPLSDADYKYKATLSDNSISQHLASTGGLSKIMLGFSVNPKQFFSFGISVNYILGKYEEIWRARFEDSDLSDINNVVSTYLKGYQFTMGANIFVRELMSVGFVYNTPVELNSGTKIQTGYTTREETESIVEIPNSFGFGILFNLRKDLFVSSDYYRRNFKEMTSNGTILVDFKDSDRISFGFEYFPGETKKYSYRLGAYHYNSYLDNPVLGTVKEREITVGFGSLINRAAGRIDFAGVVGSKSCSSGFLSNERIFRLIIAFSGGERWFERDKR